jgi:hypothetical protein
LLQALCLLGFFVFAAEKTRKDKKRQAKTKAFSLSLLCSSCYTYGVLREKRQEKTSKDI